MADQPSDSSAPAASPIALRLPTVYTTPSTATTAHTAPAPDWIAGRWYVTHSSLPLWKDKRDVTIDYNVLPPDAAGIVRVEDTTSYRGLGSAKVKTIRGCNTPSGTAQAGTHAGAHDWWGYGWLKVATSHWEILGHGECAGGGQWLVTHFHKTLFTPEGIDVYSREKRGLPAETLADVTKGLQGLESDGFKKMVDALFEVRHDQES